LVHVGPLGDFRESRRMPAPKQICLDFCWCFISIFNC